MVSTVTISACASSLPQLTSGSGQATPILTQHQTPANCSTNLELRITRILRPKVPAVTSHIFLPAVIWTVRQLELRINQEWTVPLIRRDMHTGFRKISIPAETARA